MALGACVIEKHFTLSRSDKGPDSEFSLEPQELQRLCEEVKASWAALGSTGFSREKAEQGSKVFRRSLYIVEDVKKGEKLTDKNLRRIRPGLGMEAKFYGKALGQTVKRDLKKGEPLTSGDLG